MSLEQLGRVRHGARAALTLGVAVSIVANILHATGNVISQAIAAWAPLALLITIELIARVPVRGGWLSFARLAATATIAGIAAWVSYWHMVGVALRYGEQPGAAHLIPLTVDGLVVVAWVCLVELGGRIRETERAALAAQPAVAEAVPPPAKGPVYSPPVTAPTAAAAPAMSGARVGDDSAGQDMRQETRSAQQIEAAVRAMRLADPKVPQRQIAAAVMTSPSNVRRILARVQETDVAQPERVNGRVPELAEVPS